MVPSTLRPPLILLTACLAPLLSSCVRFDAERQAKGVRSKLVAAVAERRMLHGRATGGFAFGPGPARKRGVSQRADVPLEVLRVAAELRKAFDMDPSPATTGDLSLAYLLTGDASRGTKLAELRVLQAETAEALTDLSAAHLERAINDDGPDEFARAYDAALRALRKQPELKEALFNRAMAADGMGLAWIARQAWDEYLAVDAHGPWAEVAREARARVAAREAENDRLALERPRIFAAWAEKQLGDVRRIASQRPDLARELLRREALPALAAEKLAGRSLQTSLAIALELNGIAEAVDRDPLDREAMLALERGDAELAAAHIEFAKASQALEDRKVEEGAPAVLHAAAVFRRKGSPYAALGELQSALADHFRGNRAGLIARYTSMISRHGDHYPLLRARAHWMRALSERFVNANEQRAYLDTREAHAAWAEARQVDPARQAASQLWASLKGLGREAEASRLLSKISTALSVEDPPLGAFAVVQRLTNHLRNLGLFQAALEVRRLAEGTLQRAGPTLVLSATLETVELAIAMDERPFAAQALASAARSLAKVRDREIAQDLGTVYDLATLATGPFARPIGQDAGGLIRTLRMRKNEIYLKKALTFEGEGHVAAGRADLGEASLREALALHLASRSNSIGEFERVKAFEAAERPADDLVDLLSARGRSGEALTLIEQLRNPDEAGAHTIERLKAKLDSGEAVLTYWLLKERTLATVLTCDRVLHFSLPIRRASLRRLVERLNAALEVGSEQLTSRALAELHESIVTPLVPSLGSTKRLIIIPDREMWGIPFAGLASSKTALPMAARYEIAFAPSLREFDRRRQAWSKPRSILAIGAPSWSPDLFGNLSRLPESLHEARGVAALYELYELLTGDEATISSVQRLAPAYEVVHFATHAIGNDPEPGLSFLVLSADGNSDGAWRAKDAGWDSLSKARLVVLSACRTSSQTSRFGGVSLGVLRSIQRSTTAQILASIGDVDDAAARRLLEAFHRNLIDGQAPSAALRRAQMEARNQESGITWMLYRIVA
jgi:CHAT domain-containing protein